MPVREKAVMRGLNHLTGGISFNVLDHVAKVGSILGDRVEMSMDTFEDTFREPAHALFEHVVDGIDWNRVLIEAGVRHLTLHDKDDLGSFTDSFSGNVVCGQCINEALLSRGFHDWNQEPKVKRAAQ
jgi:hypothetical protein